MPTKLTSATAHLAVAMGAVYLIWRAGWTLNGGAPVASIVVFILEAAALVGFAVRVLLTARTAGTGAGEAATLAPLSASSVTVLIPTSDDDREVLVPSVACATSMLTPHETWILDTGRRTWVGQMAAALGARHVALGSEDRGLAASVNAVLPAITTDLVAIFEPEQVPHREFLARTVRHFDHDPDLAIVQTPLEAYNTDSFVHEGEWVRGAEFHHSIQSPIPGDGTIWCGTNAVMRTKALLAVGGVASTPGAEAAHTSLELMSKGWRTLTHPEALGRGLAPASFSDYDTGHRRWCRGAAAVLRSERFLTASALSSRQRLSLLWALGHWATTAWWIVAVQIAAIGIALTGSSPVGAAPALTLAIATTMVALRHLVRAGLSGGRHNALMAAEFDLLGVGGAVAATFGRRPRRRSAGHDEAPSTSTDRTPGRLPVPLIVMGAANALGAVAGGLRLAGLGPAVSAWGVAPAVAICLGWVWLAQRAARRVTDPRFAVERRTSYRADGQLPARLNEQRCTLVSFGLNGGAVTAPGRLHLHHESTLELHFAGQPRRFRIEPVRQGTKSDEPLSDVISFRWSPDQWEHLGLLARALMAHRFGRGFGRAARAPEAGGAQAA